MPEREPDREPNIDSDVLEESPATAPRRGGFDPRLAGIYAAGALVLVLVFAIAFSVIESKSSDKAAPQTRSELKLDTSPGEFTVTTLPNAGLVAMDGTVVDLPAITKGKPAMINFFSRSCTACRAEMPALEALHGQMKDNVRLIGVNLGDSPAVTAGFVKAMGVTYEVVRDPTMLLVTRLQVTAQPFTIWTDASGKIVGHRYGGMTPTEMRADLAKYLDVKVPLP